MDRITGTAVADIGGGKRGFQDEILSTGSGSQEGTVVTANWLNAVQEEVLNVIEESGQVPDDGDLTQLSQALKLAGLQHGTTVYYTAGSHTFITPQTGWYWVECYGGGGGGGYDAASNVGEGGGGGGYAGKWILLTEGDEVSVTVGGGGDTNISGTTNGPAGGTTSFGAYCSATGGGGGILNSAGGAGGIGVGGDISLTGQAGGDGLSGHHPYGYGGDCAGPHGGKGGLSAAGATWPGGGGSLAAGPGGFQWEAEGIQGGVIIRY
ncbi:hypothetical protein [Martelella mediterranea]|uniref:Glycine-rich domain-containing protein n=1 Tax=Martelella mediterranea TaxID=293089 RepID=A0A4R3NLG6_9HYPH|nr:hypothetical protein [Martelella mediterranea]TCT35364.1 hypothetical protein EDC90_102619 [Martelella mediterranea]